MRSSIPVSLGSPQWTRFEHRIRSASGWSLVRPMSGSRKITRREKQPAARGLCPASNLANLRDCARVRERLERRLKSMESTATGGEP